MDRDGTEDGYELDADARGRRRRGRAGDRLAAARARSTTWSTRSSEGGADAVLCASIFHYGQLHGARGQGAHARRPASRSGSDGRAAAADLRERVRRLPGMERLLPALEGLPPAYLVGGAVRDLLRGAAPVDLDLAVEGDARSVARALAERLGGDGARARALRHRDGASPASSTFDLATTRTRDLRRARRAAARGAARRSTRTSAGATSRSTRWRSALDGRRPRPPLRPPRRPRPTSRRGSIRVLHDGSFLDDPTRLLRAVRYETRLGLRDGRGHRARRARGASPTDALVDRLRRARCATS